MKPESRFWQEVKKNIKNISFTRLESWASLGVPDLLCYNNNGTFFTVELKVTSGKNMRFSPHQISFHVKHPKNSFILKKTVSRDQPELYAGTQIMQLVDREPCSPIAESWTMIQKIFDSLITKSR